jgi:hypothetical protein
MFTGDDGEVVAHGRRCLATATDAMERTLGLMVLGNALFFTEQLDEAATVLDALRDLATSSGYSTAIATARHMSGILLAETDPAAALAEFEAGLDEVAGLDLFVAESNLRRELIPVLMRTDRPRAIRAAADFLKRCDDHNDTGQVNNGVAYVVTILHDLGALELAAEAAGNVGQPLLAPTSATEYRATDDSLRRRLGDDYETRATAGRNRSTKDLIGSILEVLASNS